MQTDCLAHQTPYAIPDNGAADSFAGDDAESTVGQAIRAYAEHEPAIRAATSLTAQPVEIGPSCQSVSVCQHAYRGRFLVLVDPHHKRPRALSDGIMLLDGEDLTPLVTPGAEHLPSALG